MIINIIIFSLSIIFGIFLYKKDENFKKKIKDIKTDFIKSFIITTIPLVIFDQTLPIISLYSIINSVIGKGISVSLSFIFYHLYVEPFTSRF